MNLEYGELLWGDFASVYCYLLVPSFPGNVDRKIQGTLTLGSKDILTLFNFAILNCAINWNRGSINWELGRGVVVKSWIQL